MKILMVLTSHGRLGDTGERTGFWLEEFAAPYYALRDAGAHVTLASPRGGAPPIDPRSDAPEAQTEWTRRFHADDFAQMQLMATLPLSDIVPSEYDAVFYPGGHGPLWDLAESKDSIEVLEAFVRAGKPIAAVCHGPAAFRHVTGVDGRSIVAGKNVTGFSDSEEAAVQLTHVVPFSVEQMLKENGGRYEHAENFLPFVVVDGSLVTGQNPASSEPAAKALLGLLPAVSK